MIDITQLKPSSIEVLKNIYTDQCDTVNFMQNFGTAFEKAIANLILTVVEGKEND